MKKKDWGNSMNLNEAINIIQEKFVVEKIDSNAYEIYTGKMFDEFNSFFLAIVEENDKCTLTDFAKTCELLDISEENLKDLATECGLIFDDYYIKKDFASIKDISSFLTFFDRISILK